MNLKHVGILTAMAVSFAMAQDATPAAQPAAPETVAQTPAVQAPAEPAPVVEQAPAQAAPTYEEKMQAVEQELAPENLFAEPAAVRGADAAKPVQTTTTKKFVYRPVYSASEIETSGGTVKTIYVAEQEMGDTISMDKLRGLIPFQFTFGVQALVGGTLLSGDNGRYEYDRYGGLSWSVGAFALFPLDEYNMALKASVMFEHSKVSNSYNGIVDDNAGEWRMSFSQYRISVPLLLSMKGAKSNIYFDLGLQPSFAVSDKFKMKYPRDPSQNRKDDMIDNDCRQILDWSIVLGFGLRANRYVGFDARFTWGINNQYDDYDKWAVNNLSSKSFMIGATFYAF
jgi:hypothetical protein